MATPRRRATTRRKSRKKFIQGAIKRPGALRRTLGAKKGQPIPISKLRTAAKRPGRVGRQARFALMLRGLSKKRKRRTTTRRRRSR